MTRRPLLLTVERMNSMPGLHINLDGAWESNILGLPELDCREQGRRLRYITSRGEIDALERSLSGTAAPFILYGSGDFHHLAAVFVRRAAAALSEDKQLTVVSFDNHPDWDIRPPAWACGGWVNRALQSPRVGQVHVWGCGNFELKFPGRLFANHAALRSGRLQIHAWGERFRKLSKPFDAMAHDNWRAKLEAFAAALSGTAIYITVDMDCLQSEEAVTNWENGLFTADDVAWAIRQLRARANVVAGDLCGAWSAGSYARPFQRFAASWDHPRLPPPDLLHTRTVNRAALEKIWPALSAG